MTVKMRVSFLLNIDINESFLGILLSNSIFSLSLIAEVLQPNLYLTSSLKV